MPKTHELRDLRITKIALVRKGYRPINNGSVITIVKAQEDSTVPNSTLAERIAGVFAKLLGEDEADPTDPVQKSNTAKINEGDLNCGPDGSHTPMTGKHSHEHASHYAMLTHGHQHEHNGDGDHYHDHVLKAEEAGLPDGWEIVTREDLLEMLSTGPTEEQVHKAAADLIDEKLKPITEKLATLAAEALANREEVSKAMPTDEKLTELIDGRLEPIIKKAFEDFAVAFNRQPRTPNVTRDIPPPGTGDGDNGQVRYEDVKDLDFSSALRKITAPGAPRP